MKQSNLFLSGKWQARMPRPYDCVRRAWHSESHQPIRGTLIQDIFRVVNEIHGSATKKNREYQEKLPVVVLRAEEIMYSKADSEAEYMDLTTLLDRTNDAIDTIIRRDEHTESGEYLQPCIEAALNLGCPIRKASRSQRGNPMCYMSHSTEEVPSDSHDTTRNANGRDHRTSSQYVSENVDSISKNECREHGQPLNMFSVYPLYYGDQNYIHFAESQEDLKLKVAPNSVSNNFGADISDCDQNPLPCNSTPSCHPFVVNNDVADPCTNKCDLSLRLGPS